MKQKPKVHEWIFLDKRMIGAIMNDSTGYFYRPKRNSVTKGAHDPKKDGQYFHTVSELKKTLY